MKADESIIQVVEGNLYYKKCGSKITLIVLNSGPGLIENYLLPQMCAFAKNNCVIL